VLIFLSCISFNTYAAKELFYDYSDTNKLKGVVIQASRFSKRVAILMRDTTLSGNRFDYRWHKGPDLNGRLSTINFKLSAFCVDSALASYCDSILANDPKNDMISLTSWPKKSIPKLTRKYIRLYMGYIDEKEEKNIVVQFVSVKEFKRYQNIYIEELFLVVPRKELHFALINIGQ
jgi:hypothetical protein